MHSILFPLWVFPGMADGDTPPGARSSIAGPMAHEGDDDYSTAVLLFSVTIFPARVFYVTGSPTSRFGRGAEAGFAKSKLHVVACAVWTDECLWRGSVGESPGLGVGGALPVGSVYPNLSVGCSYHGGWASRGG